MLVIQIPILVFLGGIACFVLVILSILRLSAWHYQIKYAKLARMLPASPQPPRLPIIYKGGEDDD